MADERDERALQAIEAALEQCPTAEFRSRLRKDLQRSILVTRTATRAQGARPGFTAVTPFVNTPAAEELIAFVKHVGRDVLGVNAIPGPPKRVGVDPVKMPVVEIHEPRGVGLRGREQATVLVQVCRVHYVCSV